MTYYSKGEGTTMSSCADFDCHYSSPRLNTHDYNINIIW